MERILKLRGCILQVKKKHNKTKPQKKKHNKNNYNREKSEEKPKDLTLSVTQSASGHSSERNAITIALMQDKSLPTILFVQIQFFLSLKQGREYTYGHIHSQKNKQTNKKKTETLKRPPKAFSLSTKYTLLHYNSKK